MREIPHQRQFDVVWNLFTSFGYFAEEVENHRAMQEMTERVAPGGTFCIDFINRERVMDGYSSSDWLQLSEREFVLYERTFDMLAGINRECRIRVIDGHVESVTNVTVRFYTARELVDMLAQCGLVVTQTYGDFDGNPLERTSPRVILIAKKR
jgi:SAM-dependent methyltransferase